MNAGIYFGILFKARQEYVRDHHAYVARTAAHMIRTTPVVSALCQQPLPARLVVPCHGQTGSTVSLPSLHPSLRRCALNRPESISDLGLTLPGTQGPRLGIHRVDLKGDNLRQTKTVVSHEMKVHIITPVCLASPVDRSQQFLYEFPRNRSGRMFAAIHPRRVDGIETNRHQPVIVSMG